MIKTIISFLVNLFGAIGPWVATIVSYVVSKQEAIKDFFKRTDAAAKDPGMSDLSKAAQGSEADLEEELKKRGK